MALDFPNTPVDGQVYDNFIYDATKGTWKSLSSGASPNYLVSPTITDAVITATATTPSTVPITVNGAASQSANLQEWKNSAGIDVASVSPTGQVNASSVSAEVITANAGASSLQIKPGTSNHAYISYFARTASPNTRNAYVGFPGVGSNIFTIANEIANSSISLLSNTVVMPNQPSFMAWRTTSTAVNNVIVYNNVQHNTGGHYNTSNGRFTAPVAGRYAFSINSIGNLSGSTIRLTVRVNGSRSTIGSDFQLRIPVTANYNQGSLNFVWSLAANDFVDVFITEGTEYSDGSAYSNWSGRLIG
jgi:hypothetical protein